MRRGSSGVLSIVFAILSHMLPWSTRGDGSFDPEADRQWEEDMALRKRKRENHRNEKKRLAETEESKNPKN